MKKKEKKYPSGVFGFLARLRDSGALSQMPASWGKIMIAFLSHRNPQGYAWPSQRTIAEEAGCDRRTVRRFIGWTKACLGWRVTRSKYNNYFIPLNEEVDNWFPSYPQKRRQKRTAEHPKELETKN